MTLMRRIVYLSWPAKEIAGGIKLAYRHVESLRVVGIEAVVATPNGEAPDWFATEAPTLNLDEVTPGSDILVFPENHAGLLREYRVSSAPKVVLCQNQFMAFRGLAGSRCYSEFGVKHIFALGRMAAEFCERRFPELRVSHFPAYVDPQQFQVNSSKRLQIAYTPRKRPLEAEFVKDLFRASYPEWKAIPWIPIDGKSEKQVATILGDSALYLSLCRFESYALTVLEAMASGCLVAGFTGFGARLYTTDSNGFWCEEDDLPGCAATLAKAAHLVTSGNWQHSEMVNAAVQTARLHTRQKFDRAVLDFWEKFTANGVQPPDA
jgi:hypothetical protein